MYVFREPLIERFYFFQVGELAKEMNIPKILTCSALTGQGIKSLIDEAVRMSPLFRDSFRQTTDKACCCDLL